MQEATLFEELQTIHAQYSTRDEQLQQTAAMKAETCAMEHQQQLQEQKLQISTAAEAKVHYVETLSHMPSLHNVGKNPF